MVGVLIRVVRVVLFPGFVPLRDEWEDFADVSVEFAVSVPVVSVEVVLVPDTSVPVVSVPMAVEVEVEDDVVPVVPEEFVPLFSIINVFVSNVIETA